MIRCLDPLISLPATDPARAHAFYAGTLGLEPVVEVPETGFYIYRAGEEGQPRFIGIHRHEGAIAPAERQGVWMWLKVDDIPETRRALEAKGVRFVSEPRSLGPGDEIEFLDSEGNVLRLYAPIREVRRSVEIAAAPDAVFRALTDAREIERWFTAIDDVELDAREGGAIRFIDPLFGRVTGTVTALEAPRRIAFEFAENWPTSLEIIVTPGDGATTRVEVVQRGFAAIEERDFGIPGLIEQLEAAIAALRLLCEGGLAAAATGYALREMLGGAKEEKAKG